MRNVSCRVQKDSALLQQPGRATSSCSAECEDALAQAQAQASNSRLSVHTAVGTAALDLWSTGNSGAAPEGRQQACSSGRSSGKEAELASTGLCGNLEQGLMAPTPPQKAQRRPRRSGSSGSPSEDNLSMTGLMDSGSGGASNQSSKVRAPANSQGRYACLLS